MSKKNEFQQKANNNRKSNWIVIGIVLILGLAATGFYFINALDRINQQQVAEVTRGQGGNYNIGQPVSYQGLLVGMTDIELIEIGEMVAFPLSVIEEKKIIAADYMFNSSKSRLPITAYISPEGRVVVAVAVCEPCQSESFHIRGQELVCDACATKWDLNTLEGISGGCMNYPPDELPYTVIDGMVKVEKAALEAWRPRQL